MMKALRLCSSTYSAISAARCKMQTRTVIAAIKHQSISVSSNQTSSTNLRRNFTSSKSAKPIKMHQHALRGFVCAASGTTKEVKVSHILLPEDANDLMNQLVAKITSGEATLQDLAPLHSTCPSRSNGGDIGFFGKGKTVPEFEEAAFGAKKGDIVTCKTQFGLHILTVTDEREAVEVQDLNVKDLKEILEATTASGGNTDIQFIDVREEREHQMAALPHFQLLPTSKFDEWAPLLDSQFDKDKETIVLCHHGIRSLQVGMYLVGQGFKNVKNVTGGIAGYSLAADPSVPQY